MTGPEGSTRAEVLEALKWLAFTHGYPPTVRDIGNYVGLKSTSSVHAHLESLVAEGKIERLPGSRGYRAVEVEDAEA